MAQGYQERAGSSSSSSVVKARVELLQPQTAITAASAAALQLLPAPVAAPLAAVARSDEGHNGALEHAAPYLAAGNRAAAGTQLRVRRAAGAERGCMPQRIVY